MDNQADVSLPGAPVSVAPRDITRGGAGPASWADDLSPIASADWSLDLAGHRLRLWRALRVAIVLEDDEQRQAPF